MPRGGGGSGGRGHKSGHKGQRRHFSNPDELEAQKEKEAREKQWRQQRGQDSDSDSEDEKKEKGSGDSESETSSSSEDEGPTKAKGVEGLIDIENPNRVVKKTKKVSQLDSLEETKPELSRKEREEVERQMARANYLRLHAAGKTDDARADLARLAIIKKQREDAAKKKQAEQEARDAQAKAKTESTKKALGRNKT